MGIEPTSEAWEATERVLFSSPPSHQQADRLSRDRNEAVAKRQIQYGGFGALQPPATSFLVDVTGVSVTS